MRHAHRCNGVQLAILAGQLHPAGLDHHETERVLEDALGMVGLSVQEFGETFELWG